MTGTSGRNLWVTGLDSKTRAHELKAHFSKHAKVGVSQLLVKRHLLSLYL